MISIGIDISKEKFTACALEQGNKVIWKSYDVMNSKSEIEKFLRRMADVTDVRIVMEATGKYHLPILYTLKANGYFVSVVNPLKMKQFCLSISFRKAKNDRLDAKQIAEYGLIYWDTLGNYNLDNTNYQELKHLNRSYQHYMELRVCQINFIDHIIDQTFPGIKKLIPHGSQDFSKDKLLDFLEKWWHKDKVLELSEEEFVKKYQIWAKEKRYHPNTQKLSPSIALLRKVSPLNPLTAHI